MKKIQLYFMMAVVESLYDIQLKIGINRGNYEKLLNVKDMIRKELKK